MGISTTTNEYEVCPCCNGKKTQTNKEGMVTLCPCCKGTGRVRTPGVYYM